ncbi:MAG: YXWGXW repeat-containing protein [Polyangiaceae bacterium]|nr:YXWGXW repeat-containing protein [Polyangiaceae bacterium]MCE7888690.1 hypothetical protein [Sorangiineae bacterium PRO1]MCL4753198.1 YXWGXW repeat-containing protein [Myxococcales bacterium]
MARRSLTLLGLLGLACSSGIPGPPTGPHPGNAALIVSVEYPPPPAVAEVVPERPDNEDCVWLDGHWDWVAGRWEWQSGAWVVPPKGCYYRPVSMSWPQAGALQVLRAYWYPNNVDELTPEKAQRACAEPVSCGRPAQKYKPGGAAAQ